MLKSVVVVVDLSIGQMLKRTVIPLILENNTLINELIYTSLLTGVLRDENYKKECFLLNSLLLEFWQWRGIQILLISHTFLPVDVG